MAKKFILMILACYIIFSVTGCRQTVNRQENVGVSTEGNELSIKIDSIGATSTYGYSLIFTEENGKIKAKFSCTNGRGFEQEINKLNKGDIIDLSIDIGKADGKTDLIIIQNDNVIESYTLAEAKTIHKTIAVDPGRYTLKFTLNNAELTAGIKYKFNGTDSIAPEHFKPEANQELRLSDRNIRKPARSDYVSE